MIQIYLTRILSLNKIPGRIFIFSVLVYLFSGTMSFTLLSQGAEENRALAVVQKMESAFKTVEDYTCEVEQIFYQNGEENRRFRFKLYFKRGKKIRVDFSHPYSSLTIFYSEGDKEATVLPFRFMPALKFRVMIDNPMIYTPAGQKINQTDMEYFIKFLFKNLEKVKQKREEFYEDEDQIRFWVWGLDYIEGKDLEKYRIFISKRNWLPIRIERYHLEGKPLEVSIIQNYRINTGLKEGLLSP
jgi:outer membrane lipoprotein-sorting protein